MFPFREDSICYTNITETFYHEHSIDMLATTSDLSTIGGRIRYYRIANNLSQEDVATKADIDACTIKRYENNQVLHSLETCNKIADAIGVNPLLIYDEYLIFISSDYGKLIRSTRKNLNLTQSQFSTLMGVHRKTITRWEKKISWPSRKFYSYLIKFYNK